VTVQMLLNNEIKDKNKYFVFKLRLLLPVLVVIVISM